MCRELSQINVTEKCSYITNNSGCTEADAFINYLDLVYCQMPDVLPLAYTLGFIWILAMFVTLGNLAERFFCPALEVIAKNLSMSQNVAGVTLVAFGNASPDIFAAVAGAKQTRANLVFGALFGGGIFVTTCVAGCIMLFPPFQIMQRPFLRDVVMYMFSVYSVYFTFYNGSLTIFHTCAFIILYVVYLTVVLASHRIYQKCMKIVPPTVMSYYDLETDTVQPAIMSPSLLEFHREVSERTCLLRTSTPPSNSIVPDPFSGFNATTTLHCEPLPFYKAISPITVSGWLASRWYKKIYDICKAPFIFVLKITVPSIRHTRPNHNWCRHLNALHCVTSPLFIAFCFVHANVYSGDPTKVIFVIGVVGFLVAGIVLATSTNEEPPTYHNAFAYLAFFVGINWIYLLTTEIVIVLKAAGSIFNVGDSILGMTILAWGNGVTDAVTTLTIAYKLNYHRMALAACFGGPVMNLLLGIGIPFTMATVDSGKPIVTEFNTEDIILTTFLLASLVCSLLILTFVLKFRTSRVYGAFLIGLYVLFLTVTFLNEMDLLKFIFDD